MLGEEIEDDYETQEMPFSTPIRFKTFEEYNMYMDMLDQQKQAIKENRQERQKEYQESRKFREVQLLDKLIKTIKESGILQMVQAAKDGDIATRCSTEALKYLMLNSNTSTSTPNVIEIASRAVAIGKEMARLLKE